MAKPAQWLEANRRFVLNVIAVIASVAVVVAVLGFYLQSELTQSMRQSTELTFSAVYNAVNTEFDEVTNACDVMRSDPFLIEALKHEESDESAFRAKVSSYLSDISDRYDLSTAYLVSDASMRYYLPDGTVTILDPEHDEWDDWYTALVASNDDYHVDVDVDKHNTNKWTIFIDWRIIDEEGKTLGVTGVGLDMDVVMGIARHYSDIFGMHVSFVSDDGTSFVGTDLSHVSEAQRNISFQESDETVVTRIKDGFVVSRYVPLIGWHLVVENNSGIVSKSMFGLIGMSVLLLCVSLIVVVVLNGRIFSRERNALTRRANTDPLTGLFNRAGLEQQAQSYLDDRGDAVSACLIAVDVDQFKEVNDTYGHATGDQVLCEVAAVLRNVFRDSDILARPGGDEFTAFLPAMEQGDALKQRAQDLHERGQLSYRGDDGTEVRITLSFGIALAPQNGTTFEELSRAADAALYEAKRAGRNCYRFAS